MCSRSLALLRSRLLDQYSALVTGRLFPRRQLCLCQKQPCTKITFRCETRTMSGLPGNFAEYRAYLNPIEWIRQRTFISGLVSLPLTARMQSERWTTLRLSVKSFFIEPIQLIFRMRASYCCARSSHDCWDTASTAAVATTRQSVA